MNKKEFEKQAREIVSRNSDCIKCKKEKYCKKHNLNKNWIAWERNCDDLEVKDNKH